MCGLTGGWTQRYFAALAEALPLMTASLAHRGPDDTGFWTDAESGIALGHRRLAVLDLSPQGSQPMVSASGRFVIAFNGEIYNHLALRRELESAQRAPSWRGHSDTETLLAAVEAWGLVDCLKRCVGMFALALWDRLERGLSFARDRLGEKPLYYGWQKGSLLFGSELKALRAAPGFLGTVNRDAIALLLRHGYVAAPFSIYEGIAKLTPGTVLRFDAVSLQEERLPEPQPYWSLSEAAAGGGLAEQPSLSGAGDSAVAVDALEALLGDAVAQQMVADVPLGAFLSGGVDSSVVVALMQARAMQPVKTFTIGFHEAEFNEAVYAQEVARHLGTEHTELYVSPQDAIAVIPRLPEIYDEPFGDSSQIPTFLVSRLARDHVTVSLSGDGGDEVFFGYSRYAAAMGPWQHAKRIPFPLRLAMSSMIRSMPVSMAERFVKSAKSTAWQSGIAELNVDRLYKLAELFSARSVNDFYRSTVTHWAQAEVIALGSVRLPTPLDDDGLWDSDYAALSSTLMTVDMGSYLPGDILVKLDRAAMAVSLETRCPFLDHRVVEFGLSLPLHHKWQNGVGKRLLKRLLARYVPAQLVERPKMGFGVPIAEWLRGPLRNWAETLLDERRLQTEGWFDAQPIRQKLSEHLQGRRNWQPQLWAVLMFQAWLDEQRR